VDVFVDPDVLVTRLLSCFGDGKLLSWSSLS